MGSPSPTFKGSNNGGSHDYSFKILLVGDSGVGKSSLLLSFISNNPVSDLSPTIGVDFKVKLLCIGDKRLKLTIWDTAGQERHGTLISSYYRGAHGIILVYDVTRRESFANLSESWAKEVELYSSNEECVRLLVGNKVDREEERSVTTEEGLALAREHNCVFFECSAKTRENVKQCFKELSLKVCELSVHCLCSCCCTSHSLASKDGIASVLVLGGLTQVACPIVVVRSKLVSWHLPWEDSR